VLSKLQQLGLPFEFKSQVKSWRIKRNYLKHRDSALIGKKPGPKKGTSIRHLLPLRQRKKNSNL
jgi:hypothetical protein